MIRKCLNVLLVLLVTCKGIAYAQTSEITGRVLDSKTSEPLPFANVFINNTTIGAAADVNGEFVIRNVSPGSVELVFSYVGYQSYQTTVVVKSTEALRVNIKLMQDQQQLESVEVKSTRDKVWEKQLKKFEKIFLGSSKYSATCRILNPWELEFKEENDLFTAAAHNPLEIENLSLGYKQFYYLRGFHANLESYSILGNSRFESLLTDDPVVAAKWDANRKEVYKGSIRHLLKSLVNKRAKQEGFLLYTNPQEVRNADRQTVFSLDKDVRNFKADSVLFPGKFTGEFRVLVKGRVEVHFTQRYAALKTYKDIPYPVGWIETSGNYIDVNANGVILNPGKVVTSGYLSEARIAEQLPLDYQEDEASTVISDDQTLTSATLSHQKIIRLKEQINLHTDKPYYYKGEMIWFKMYLQYAEPSLRDSLSRVVYVDLIDSKRRILQTTLFPIDSGFSKGNLLLADTLPAGDYWLRAYTAWMLNYGNEQLLVKPIAVLNLTDKIQRDALSVRKATSTQNIILKTDKDFYSPREKITVSLAARDFYNEASRANLSVSVTDVQQVTSVMEDSTINKNKVLPDNLSMRQFRFPVEFGLPIRGTFTNDKDKPEQTSITIVQGKFDDIVTVDSDIQGNFEVTGFNFFDTVQFAFQAKNNKKKTYGHVALKHHMSPAVEHDYPKLNFPVVSTENPQRLLQNYQPHKDTRVLEEVTVTASKIETTKQPILQGQARHVIEGSDVVRSVAGGNIITALQGKIPGLQIVSYWDEQLVQQYKIKVRGGSSSITGSGEPLILVDGIPMGSSDQSAVKQLSNIPADNVDRIEVITKVSPIYGVRGTNGVIAVYTKSGMYARPDVNNAIDTKSFQIVPAIGYSRSLKFISPDYEKKEDSHAQPDYRSTLFWAPEVITGGDGTATFSFFAGDLKTNYRITVKGIDQFGKAVQAERLIEIK